MIEQTANKVLTNFYKSFTAEQYEAEIFSIRPAYEDFKREQAQALASTIETNASEENLINFLDTLIRSSLDLKKDYDAKKVHSYSSWQAIQSKFFEKASREEIELLESIDPQASEEFISSLSDNDLTKVFGQSLVNQSGFADYIKNDHEKIFLRRIEKNFLDQASLEELKAFKDKGFEFNINRLFTMPEETMTSIMVSHILNKPDHLAYMLETYPEIFQDDKEGFITQVMVSVPVFIENFEEQVISGEGFDSPEFTQALERLTQSFAHIRSTGLDIVVQSEQAEFRSLEEYLDRLIEKDIHESTRQALVRIKNGLGL